MNRLLMARTAIAGLFACGTAMAVQLRQHALGGAVTKIANDAVNEAVIGVAGSEHRRPDEVQFGIAECLGEIREPEAGGARH